MNSRIFARLFVGLLMLGSSIDSFAAPGTLTVSPQIPQRPTYVRRVTFANGITAVRTAHSITFTWRNGKQVTRDAPTPAGVPPHSADRCQQQKHWLDTHGDSSDWRKHCLSYLDHCLGTT